MTPRDVAWLIEADTPIEERRWWEGQLWTDDSLKAIRFARKQDAQGVIDAVNRMMHRIGADRWLKAHPTEHVWLPSPLPWGAAS